ncbi:hypothetical protein [Paenibacillus chitinolyticus]|uniref:hypothetical protein n=1 Tax=Paenibacillus chitinolyticus TaxID=79263 RepID=UPI003656B953
MAKFISRCSNQVLCIKPARVQNHDGIIFPVPGEHIRFNAGEYETEDEKEIEFLRKHRLFGSSIFEDKLDEKKAAKKETS